MTVRTQLVAFGCVLLVVGIWDFAGRLYVGRDASLRALHAQKALPLPPAESVGAIRRRMLGWLPAIAGSANEPPDPADATAWRLSLAGVFAQRGTAIAVVRASLPAGGPVETLRVVEGDTIHGWTVAHVDAHGVILTHGAETRELALFRRGQLQPAGAGLGPH
ncbi:MAG TPA: hypothetical protein VN787_03765 [Steroidobacteraceae bacterium]|nr:hypothetical protein [Steroidobacteraceae bacterium]